MGTTVSLVTWTFDGVLLPDGGQGRLVITGPTPGSQPQRLPGRYALPGLVDAHAHLTVQPDHTLGDNDLAMQRLHQYAGIGVATVRDVGGRSDATLALARAPEPGLPVVLAAGRFLAPRHRYFPHLHDPVSAEQLRSAADSELANGATWLKLIGDFPSMDDAGIPVPGTLAPTYDIESVRDLVQLAHQHQARVAVHTQTPHVAALVAAGVDSIEHGEWLDEDAVRELGARRGAWTPTLAAVVDPPPGSSEKRRRYGAEASERLRLLLPLAARSGVRILAGTDAVATVTREVTLLIQHGLAPQEALAAASSHAERWLRPSSAAPDSVATYDTDPRNDPAILESPIAVVVRGRRLS